MGGWRGVRGLRLVWGGLLLERGGLLRLVRGRGLVARLGRSLRGEMRGTRVRNGVVTRAIGAGVGFCEGVRKGRAERGRKQTFRESLERVLARGAGGKGGCDALVLEVASEEQG